ncbi:glyoxalase/bleomycin resistance/extradiol dioxygenase family protein [Kitasatospora aburaviensis]
MDALYNRLLVSHFAECFDFYEAVLPPLTGAVLVRLVRGPVRQLGRRRPGLLSLYDRGLMAFTIGTSGLPAEAPPVQDATMLVFRVDDVDEALTLCLRHGGTPPSSPPTAPSGDRTCAAPTSATPTAA